ncbi:hypothetical protein BDF22DRAFT_30184 [Syncephalis plumigaleata]|nr:hypothetical protein BDF22DRAFT_30184 [Syncephalis plumigaleata]
MLANTTRSIAVIMTRVASLALLPLLAITMIKSSVVSVDAVFQNYLIATFNNFTLPSAQPPMPGGEEMPPMPNCLYALGLGDHYPIVNDQCVTIRWRPGQTWKFDPEITDAYQPIRVGNNFCFSIEDAVYGANAIVVECSGDSSQVPNEAQWRVGTNGPNYWFRNLRTDLCLRGHEDKDGFSIEECSEDPFFMFKVKTF